MAASRLRVFCCLPSDTGTSLWHRQFPETLEQMGHDVYVPQEIGLSASWPLSWAGQWTKKDRSKLTQSILDDFKIRHREKPFQLFFAYIYPYQFEPELLDHIADLGVPTVYFFCDNLLYKDVAKDYSRHATLNWVPEKAAMPAFRAVGSRALYLPMAANPARNFPAGNDEFYDVTFAGGQTPYRRQILGYAISQGINVKIFGGGWLPDQVSHHTINSGSAPMTVIVPSRMERYKRWLKFKISALKRFSKHGLRPAREIRRYNSMGQEFESLVQGAATLEAIDLDRLNRLYSESRITIGANDQFNSIANPSFYCYPKMREFEATMAGACYLTQHTEDTEELFDTDKEIATYRLPEEMVEKVRELLASPERRGNMRKAAALRSKTDHTWQRRFEAVFRELGL